MIRFTSCVLIALLSACAQRIDSPAPVVNKRDEMFGPKAVSTKIKQEQMISKLIEQYGGGINSNSTEVDNTQNSAWAPANVATPDQDDAQDEPLPQPLKKAPISLTKETAKEIPIKVTQEQQKIAPKSDIAEDPVDQPLPKEEQTVNKEKNVNTNLIWPVKGKIIKDYGTSEDGSINDGINIETREGSPVVAVAEGTVAYSANKLSGFGNLIAIKHPDGLISVYANLKDIHVVKDDVVEQGQKIGTVGKTGNVKTPQLHFELRKNNKISNKKTGKKSVESFDPKKLLRD